MSKVCGSPVGRFAAVDRVIEPQVRDLVNDISIKKMSERKGTDLEHGRYEFLRINRIEGSDRE